MHFGLSLIPGASWITCAQRFGIQMELDYLASKQKLESNRLRFPCVVNTYVSHIVFIKRMLHTGLDQIISFPNLRQVPCLRNMQCAMRNAKCVVRIVLVGMSSSSERFLGFYIIK